MSLFLTSRLLSAAGVAHGFSLREGGVSVGPLASLNLGESVGDSPEAVTENHRRLRQAAGLEADFATVHQVHGDRIVDARGREVLAGTQPESRDSRDSRDSHESGGGADGVLALEPGQVVGIRVADCAPILLYDEEGGAAAAVHSGWRGSRLAIAARGVRALQHAAAADPRRMLAAIGPCIGRCCYEVSAELATGFRSLFGPEAADDPAQVAKPHLDLRFCVASALLQAGLASERIEQVARCTSCDSGAFFSHRRDKGRTGRHLAFIAAGP